MAKEGQRSTFTNNQKVILRRRGLDPKNYEFVKSTYAVLYVRDVRTGKSNQSTSAIDL